AYGTLGAVFGRQVGLTDSNVALMMSTTIFAGGEPHGGLSFPAGQGVRSPRGPPAGQTGPGTE
ncbi:MAG: hypothetical protein EOP86_16060, partial [Verrucomicrobiaceae bacterium]